MEDKSTSQEISPEVSQRIRSHMNDNHKISIYAFATATLKSADKKKKPSNPKIKSISLSGYVLSFLFCSSDLCEMKLVSVPFKPPLQSPKEAKARIIQDHFKAFTPKFSWIVTEPVTLILFLICLALAYATHFLGEDGIVSTLYESPEFVQDVVGKMFCCEYTFASNVQKFWYFTITAHVIEGLIAVYICQAHLKLPKLISLKWFILCCMAGYPVTGKVFEIGVMDKKFKEEQKQKNYKQ